MDKPVRFTAETPPQQRLVSVGLTAGAHVLVLLALFYASWYVAEPGTPFQFLNVTLNVEHSVASEAETQTRPTLVRLPMPAVPTMTLAPETAELKKVRMVRPLRNASRGESKYLAEVWMRILSTHGTYGGTARAVDLARMGKGVVLVHIIIDRKGNLMLCELQKSSGNPEMDADALDLVQKTQPFPEIPINMDDFLNTVVPIGYNGAAAMKVFEEDY
jgi:TonB family protein